jgi:hypothetical protein
MKRKLFVLIGLISIIAMPCFSAGEYNVDNYFQSPGSGSDNVLVIDGTQNVTDTFNVTTGTATFTTAPIMNGGSEINGDITLENDEVISNSTDAKIDFTDGTNTIFQISDEGTTGSVHLGNTSRKISDTAASFRLTVSTDTAILGDITLENGEKIINSTDAQVDITDGSNVLMRVSDGGTVGNVNITGTLDVDGIITSTVGFVNVIDVFDDVPASDVIGVYNVTITTTILVTGTTAWLDAITDPVMPMNVVVLSSFTAGAFEDSDITGTLTIVGYDGRGESQTETITFSTNSASGVCAWSDITSLQFTGVTTGTSPGDCTIQIGIGTILGLSNNVENSGYIRDGGDIISAQLNDSGTTTTDDGTLNSTYNTWTPDTAGDGTTDVYSIRYRVRRY